MFGLKSLILKGDGLKHPRRLRQSQTPLSCLEIQDGGTGGGKPKTGDQFDTTIIDWDNAVRMAELVARKIPPLSEADRRQWLRYAAMADRYFSEDWLLDSVEAVLTAAERRRRPQAHLVGVLKSKAVREGMTAEEFQLRARSIWVPDEVWQMNVVVIRPSGRGQHDRTDCVLR